VRLSLRRGLALVTIFIASMTVLIGVAASQADAHPASSSGKICVALVVDGRALGSDVSTACAKVSKGATGVDVLRAAGHSLVFRRDGLICTIDGLPKTGCAGIDASHYWAYFHRAPGGTTWTYSTEGASTYQPANTSTEGWVFDDGTSLAPQNVPYASICKTAKPTPSPTPSKTPTTKPSHQPSAAASAAATPKASQPAGQATTSTPSSSASHHAATTTHSATPSPASAAKSGAAKPPPTESTVAPTPTSSSVLLAGAVAPARAVHSVRNLLIGLIVVALLGGLTVYRFRRRSS
jgi:hypothetical protein